MRETEQRVAFLQAWLNKANEELRWLMRGPRRGTQQEVRPRAVPGADPQESRVYTLSLTLKLAASQRRDHRHRQGPPAG